MHSETLKLVNTMYPSKITLFLSNNFSKWIKNIYIFKLLPSLFSWCAWFLYRFPCSKQQQQQQQKRKWEETREESANELTKQLCKYFTVEQRESKFYQFRMGSPKITLKWKWDSHTMHSNPIAKQTKLVHMEVTWATICGWYRMHWRYTVVLSLVDILSIKRKQTLLLFFFLTF